MPRSAFIAAIHCESCHFPRAPPLCHFFTNSLVDEERAKECANTIRRFLRDIVQGLARDVLLDAMQRLADANYPVVLHLANKVIVESEGPAALMTMSAIMEQSPHWAKALQLTTQGYACNRYLEEKTRPSRR